MTNENRSVVLEEHVDSDYEPTEQEILDYSEWLGMDADADKDLMWIARAGLKVPLPAPWKPCTTGEENDVFYFNFETGESVWDHPCDEFHRLLYKREKARKLGEEFDEAQLEEVAERLGLPYGPESGDPLDDSGSLGQSGSGGISLPSGDGDKKKKKKKEKKEKKSKEPKKDEGRLEAPKTLAPLSTTRMGPKLSELPSAASQMEEAPPSSESKMSSRVPSQSVLSEEIAEDKEAPPAPRSSEDLPRPTGGLPPPPSGEPPTVNNSEAKSEGGTKGGTSGSQKEEKTRLEEQFEKSVAALQAEHKAKLAKHRRELQEEFEMERDKTFSELQEKHETQVRAERARLQQELASQKGKTKKELEALLESQEELQRKLNESQVEATRLRSEAASTTRKCSAYEERVARLEEDLKTLRKEATTNKTSDKEVESLKAQVDSKNEEIDRIKAEAAANADRMSKWEEEVHGLRALAGNYDEAKETISKLKKELEERGNAKNSQESEELSKNRQELESMKATVASTRESLTRELEDKSKLQMELSEARSDLAKASGNKAQLEELRRELGERTKELADAREAIVTASANGAGELDKVKSQLEEEKRTSASTSRSLEEATREVARLKAQINEEESIRSSIKAEAEVEGQRKEKEKFQALLDQQSQAARQAEEQLQQELLQEKEVRNQLKGQIADLKRQLDIKEASQQELRTQEQLEQALKEIEALKVELCNRTSECAQWRDQAQREDAQSSAAKLKVEVATLKAELETWRAECGRLSQASQTELPKMQALLEEEKVAASRAKAEAIEGMAQIKAQAAATAAELEARSKECGRLRAEVQACRPNGKLSQDEVRELVALRAKVLELETEAEALRQAQSITNPDEQKIRSMVKDRDNTILRLRAELVHASTRHSQELEDLQIKVNDARQEERQRKSDESSYIIGDLKGQLRSKAAEIEQLHSEVRIGKSELERVRTEVRHAEARATAREVANIEVAKAAVAGDWKKEVDRLQAELQSRSADAALAKEKAERLAREVRRVQQEESRVARGQEALRGELEQAQENTNLVREEVADAERRCEEARAATRAERSARAHAESQVRECQRELRVVKAQLQEQVADAEVIRNEARKHRFAMEDKEAEATRWQDQVRTLERELQQLKGRRDAWNQEDFKTELGATGLRTAVELSQLSEQEETLQPESEVMDPVFSPKGGLEDFAEGVDGDQHGTTSPAMDSPHGTPQEAPEAHPGAISAERERLEVTDDRMAVDPARSFPGDRGSGSPEYFSPQAMALLESRRKELDHERLTVEELRRQLKQDAHRLRSFTGMSKEQALLQEAGIALDSRVSALNRALKEHRVIQQTLQGSLEKIRTKGVPGGYPTAFKAHGDTGGDATPRSTRGGRHPERYDGYPRRSEDLGVIQLWQRILGHELNAHSSGHRTRRQSDSPLPTSRGATRSTSPLSSRRSRSYREAVDQHLAWLQNFSRQAGPLTARSYGGW
mmetsp:Transcript_4291/g.9231  ORF Transcript_4291/g.9231 Transcript_4291/m.9231 type:complete len:1481 (-) Transcript_4291:206-4648(-)